MKERLVFYETSSLVDKDGNTVSSSQEKIEIKPGTLAVGTRGFYYDMEFIVLDYERIENTGDLDKDWLITAGLILDRGELDEIKCRLNNLNIISFAEEVIKPIIITPFLSQNIEIIASFQAVNDEIIEWLLKNPERINTLHPAAFEDLVKKIYQNQGFIIESMGNWNQADGGVDLFAIQKTAGTHDIKLAIQCKRTINNIQPRIIRELNGVLDRNEAHMGIVATTSYFTEAAKEEAKNFHWRIGLEDRDKIVDKMRAVFG